MDIDEMYEMAAERVRKIVLEFIELDSDNLLLKQVLIDGVEEIDFTEPDAFETLAKLIETYSTSSESGLEMIEIGNIDLGPGGVMEYTTRTIKTHEHVELLLEEPWRSSALRKLWKGITCFEFKEMWDDGDGLLLVENLLQILLLIADEDAYVPFVAPMIKSQQPIAVDEAYRIRDNQFWYNDCKFCHLVEDRSTIVVNIEGLGTRTLTHSKEGIDGRTTLSYKFPSSEDREWWEEHRGKLVRVGLLSIEG